MAIRPIGKEGRADVTPASASGPTLDSPRSPSPEGQARETEHVGREARIEAITDRILFLNRFFEEGAEGKPKYRVLELIGRGGMGAVFKAEQRTPIKRLVAIKLVKPGYDTKEVIARFESEKQALARMDHGSVAKVLDAGADDMGRPYFVMEYVPGAAITDFADQNKLPIRKRLELFVDVCEAVSHAHSKAIIHRDIKSSNVLAYFSSGKPVVKVIDFGIAKALTGDRLTDATMNTRHGQLLGTYESMSPEQAEGSPDIDTRTDVYSLGALLYELLTGAAPFDRAMFSKAPDQEIRRIIREVEPPRPSTRVTSLGGDEGTKVATARQEPLSELAAELRTELEWIPLMAMRKSRDRRYATPLELADDVKRYLEDRPLRAGPESKWYVAKKTFRRHRFAIGAAAAVFLSSAVGLVVSTYLLNRTLQAEAEVTREVKEVETAMAFGGDYAMERGDLISARQMHVTALDLLRAHDEASSAVLAGLNELESSERGEIPLLGSYGEGGGVAAFRGHTHHANNVLVLNDKRRALTAGSDGQLYMWDSFTGRSILNRQSPGDDSLAYVAVGADGKTAVTAGSGGKVGIWDIGTLTEQTVLGKTNDKPLWMVAISPDGTRIVAGTFDGELWLWEKQGTWQEARQISKAPESIAAIAFPPGDSRYVMVGDLTGGLSLWDLVGGVKLWSTPERERHSRHVNCVVFSCDGTKAATASFDGTATIWGVRGRGAETQLVQKYRVRLQPKAWRVAFSPDGTKLAVGADGGAAAVYDAESGKVIRVFAAPRQSFNGVDFLDDVTLVSTGDDTVGPDGRTLLSALWVWDLKDRGVLFDRAAKSVAKNIAVDDLGHVRIVTTADEKIEAGFGRDGRVQAGSAEADALSADFSRQFIDALKQTSWLRGGQRISPASEGKSVGDPTEKWEEVTGTNGGNVSFFTNSGHDLELREGIGDGARAGSRLAHLRTLHGHRARIAAAAMSPNGRFVVSIDQNGRCLGWDLFRPAVLRNQEKKLGVSRDSEDVAILRNWFTFRGREDLASAVK